MPFITSHVELGQKADHCHPAHIAARPATVSATALGTAMQPRATDAPSAAVVVVIVVVFVASTTCVKLVKLKTGVVLRHGVGTKRHKA